MSFVARLGTVLAASAIALAVAGCGGTTLEQQGTEELVKEEVGKLRPGKVSSVECPSGIDVEAGRTFTCSVKFSSGKEETATLKIRDKDANLNLEGLSPSK